MWQKRHIGQGAGVGPGLLHWQDQSLTTAPASPRVGKRVASPRVIIDTSRQRPPVLAKEKNPLTSAAAMPLPWVPRQRSANAQPPSSVCSRASSRDSAPAQRTDESFRRARPAALATAQAPVTAQGVAAGRPPMPPRSRSVPNGKLSHQSHHGPPDPGSPRSMKFAKSPEKVDYLAEENHPYKNQPRPAAPPRIAGYSGHRPRAYEPVGSGFNRIEMYTNADYAHEVTYESISNPAFAAYPEGRARRLSAPSAPGAKPRKAPQCAPGMGPPYSYPWQNPKNPITGTGWYAASGEAPPPLRSSSRVVPPIGHPERYASIPDDVEQNTHYPNVNSLFCSYSPFDLD